MTNKRTSILVAISVLMTSAAWADGNGAPAQVSSDYVPEQMEVKAGEIDVADHQLSFKAGPALDSHGPGWTMQADVAQQFIFEKGEPDGNNGTVFNPGLHVRADVLKDENGDSKIRKLDLHATLGTVYRGQDLNFPNAWRTTDPKKAATALAQGKYVRTNKYSCEGLPFMPAAAKDLAEENKINQCRAGSTVQLPSCDGRKQAETDGDGKACPLVTFLDAAKFNAKSYVVYDIIHGKPRSTGDVSLLQLGVRHRDTEGTDTRLTGAQVDVLTFSGHTAWKINGFNVDLCGAFVSSVVLGDQRIGETKAPAAVGGGVKVCGGVQLGQVGRLGDEVSFDGMGLVGGDTPAGTYTMANTVSLDRIGGLPVDLNWTLEHEMAGNDGQGGEERSRTVNLFTVGGAL